MDFPATVGAFDTVFERRPDRSSGATRSSRRSPSRGDLDAARAAGGARPRRRCWRPPTARRRRSRSPSTGATWPSAASYTIQIDDSSAFTAPLVRTQTVTSSMYATSGLRDHDPLLAGARRELGGHRRARGRPCAASRRRPPPPPATLTNLDINPATVVGGDRSSGTVVAERPAPDGGAVISLSSSNPAVASVPATVTVPANGFTGTFRSRPRRSRPPRPSPSPPPTTARRERRPLTVTPAGRAGGDAAERWRSARERRRAVRARRALVTLSGAAPPAAQRCRCRAATPAWPRARERDGCRRARRARSSTSRRPRSSASTPVTITATYGGDDPDRDPHGARPRPRRRRRPRR